MSESTAVIRTDTGDGTLIDCPASLDISMVAELHGELQQALAAGKTIALKADQVERADTAALQLLVAFARQAQQQGLRWQWQGASEVMHHSAGLLGLAGLLQL